MHNINNETLIFHFQSDHDIIKDGVIAGVMKSTDRALYCRASHPHDDRPQSIGFSATISGE